MTRPTYPAGSIEDRILFNAQLSRGTMPIRILVADEAERDRAWTFVKGRPHCGKLTFPHQG